MLIQPPTKIVIYFVALLVIQFLPTHWFWTVFITSQLLAFYIEKSAFVLRITRMRWLWLSIMMIFALTTPGEFVSELLPFAKLTYEGLLSGLRQVAIILFAIASVMILFYRSEPADLVGGVHFLLKPFKCLGLSAETISVRLLLTLQYFNVLTAAGNTSVSQFKQYFYAIDTALPTIKDTQMVLKDYRFTIVELGILLLCLIVLVGVFAR